MKSFLIRLFGTTLIILYIGLSIGVVESLGMSPRSDFDYNYDYDARNACRQAAGRGRSANYTLAIQCAKQYEKDRREAKEQELMEGLIKSVTELNRQIIKDLKRKR